MKDQWNQRYSRPGLTYGWKPNAFLTENYSRIPIGKVLCLAEGEGRNAIFLAGLGYDVTMVDYSEKGVENAIQHAAELNVRLNAQVADITEFDFGKSQWSGIISVFGHIPSESRKRIHQSLSESLITGGVYIAIGYSLDQLQNKTGGPKKPDLLYDPHALALELQDLEIIRLEKVNRIIEEGNFHTGKASVVEMIAQKKQG